MHRPTGGSHDEDVLECRACVCGKLDSGFAPAHGAFAQSGDPIKIGTGLALTGGGAPAGKMLLAALELWRDDVNAKGGLLGRQVAVVVYDDQSNPNNVPGLYTKLISVDKVDLLVGPYGTNFVAPAMPTIMQNNKMTISFTAIGINRQYNYPKYFSMVPVGPAGVNAFSIGFFEMAAAQTPKPQTVAILAAEAEFAQSAAQGAREEIKKHGLKLILRSELSAELDRFHPRRARVASSQRRHRLRRGLSARQRRHRARGQ
jgi:branched-chain amino acid transport system substrate-binding protein